MPYYSRFSHTAHFTYEEHDVEIGKAFRGARHCEVYHKPRETACSICKSKITPKLVFLIKIDGVLEEDDCASEEEACELARVIIEDMVEDGDDDGEDEEDDAPSVTPPGRKDRSKQGADKGLLVAPPRDTDGRRSVIAPSDVLRQMQKLGWVERAISIIRSRSDPEPKSPNPKKP